MRPLPAAEVVLLVLLGVPVSAQTPSPRAPIVIAACRGGISSVELIEIADYDVTLRNTSSVAADDVRISARYGRHERRATFDVKETFPPHVDVTKHLHRTVSGGLFAYRSDQNDCFIDYVHFTDGTTWKAAGFMKSSRLPDTVHERF